MIAFFTILVRFGMPSWVLVGVIFGRKRLEGVLGRSIITVLLEA